MFKNLLFTSFLLLILMSIIYPSRKEKTKLLDYCYSLEKIISKNSIQKRRNQPKKVMSISRDILKFGVTKTRGFLINKMIDQYKISNNSPIIKLVPNNVYCYAGYWIENARPGTIESIFLAKSKKAINEFKDFKYEVDGILNDFNSEYKEIKKEINILF